MYTWPSSIVYHSEQGKKRRKGKSKATLLPYPRIEGGAVTSATLQDRDGHYEWFTAQGQIASRKLVCSAEAVLAFPETRPLQPRLQTTPLVQRAEQGAHFIRTHYPDVDIPAELIREQVGAEIQAENSLRSFDPLSGDLVTSFHLPNASKKWLTFMAFPMGETGCELSEVHGYRRGDAGLTLFEDFSNVEFSVKHGIFVEPSHRPVKAFDTPLLQLVSSPPSNDSDKEPVLAVRTFSSTTLLSLSMPHLKLSKKASSIEISEIGSFSRSDLDDHLAVDVRIQRSLELALLVNSQGGIFRCDLRGLAAPLGEHEDTCFLMSSKAVELADFRASGHGLQVFAAPQTGCLLTSIGSDGPGNLTRLVTTSEAAWIDPRFSSRPVFAFKHEREYDRTLTSCAINIGEALSSRRNSLITVYDVSSDKGGLVRSHTPPYCLPRCFPRGPHAGFHVITDPGGTGSACLLRLSDRGAVHQAALSFTPDGAQATPEIEIHWSDGVQTLATDSRTRKPDVGKLGARETKEIDLHHAYQRLFSPLDASESVYPTEDADAVYQTLDMMPSFWQEASATHEHLLTTYAGNARTSPSQLMYDTLSFDIAFLSGEEPTHASRADFLTRSTLSSKRGFRALSQGRVPRDTLIKKAAWHADLQPVLQRFMPDISSDAQSTADRLHKYDLILDDYRSGPSLRRESEAREQLAIDLALSTDVFCAHAFTKPETKSDDDDSFEKMSRAAEAMSLLDTEPPPVRFGFLSPTPAEDYYKRSSIEAGAADSSDVELPAVVRLLLTEWDVGSDPESYAYHDPYSDQRPAASSPIPNSPIRKRGARSQPPPTQSQRPPMVVTAAAPPIIAHSQPAPSFSMPSSQPALRRPAAGSLDAAGFSQALDSELRSQSQTFMASTQVVPGPFGGRPAAGKKKAAAGKKRISGF
ncbi:hypothetical protein BC834DRAFT_840342 [Gloeopeniophorella convolvens]|nr:hypothetical protein BC834DRAFT_840342 [Gloeopeniophorella convolvens]